MRGKIILVPFPFDDLTTTKVRPALCLTDSIGGYQHVVIAFITSQIHKAGEPSDVLIRTTDNEFSKTGLKMDSAIRLHRLLTVPVHLVERELGEISQELNLEVQQRLKQLFALP